MAFRWIGVRPFRLAPWRTLFVAALFLVPAAGSGQTLDAHRDRLIVDWASNPNIGFGTNACAAWNSLSPSAKYVFIANTHRLYVTGLLGDVEQLYSIRGGNGAACGGLEYNRTFMRMSTALHSRLALTNGGNRSSAPGWRESHDPACVTGVGECPHIPFTGQVETTSNSPTGQIQFFPWPDRLKVRREYRETDPFSPLFGQVCATSTLNVDRGTECTGGSCTTPPNNQCSMGVYSDSVVMDPRDRYYREAVGYEIQDPYSFEMDQDYGFAHDSNPACFIGPYTTNYGNPNWNWQPSACAPPPPPPCTYSLDPLLATYGTGGATGAATIYTGGGCQWSVTLSASAQGWLTLNSASSGNGTATLSYSVAPNALSAHRTAWIYVNGAGLEVRQTGVACNFTLSSSTTAFGYGGGTGTATLGGAVADCGWSVSTSASWISVTSAPSGSGNSVVSFAVAANNSPAARTGVLTVGGRSLTISQAGRMRRPAADFDGDGRSDVALFRPSTGQWFSILSSTGAQTVVSWGAPGDVPVAADYDGDGKTDVAVYRPSTGVWYRILSTVGVGSAYGFGIVGDLPVPGDYDGDGRAEIAVYRPSTGQWIGVLSTNGSIQVIQWGVSGDVPVPRDYDGDGKTDIAVYRPSTGQWHRILSTVGVGSVVGWGVPGDIPVPADYDGDWKADVAVYRPSTGQWIGIQSSTGAGAAVAFGVGTDQPVLGDYNGDGRTDFVVFRPSTGQWHALLSPSLAYVVVQFGWAGDIPANKSP